MIYKKSNPQFDVTNAVIGFQEVVGNQDKVFVWFKQTIIRSTTNLNYLHKLKPEWAKQIFNIDYILKHLKAQLNLTQEDFKEMLKGNRDIWRTSTDGDRNFIKAIVKDPVSSINNLPLNIQIIQKLGEIPKTVKERARIESFGDKDYSFLLKKYLEKAKKCTYKMTYINGERVKNLVPIYGMLQGEKKFVYEEKKLVWGETSHIYVHNTYSDTPDVNLFKSSQINQTLHRSIESARFQEGHPYKRNSTNIKK